MKLHRLHTVPRLPITMDEAWAFFSHPKNLPLITPPPLDFQMTNDVPEVMHTGTIITYTIRSMFGLRVRWTTEITHADSGKRAILNLRSSILKNPPTPPHAHTMLKRATSPFSLIFF